MQLTRLICFLAVLAAGLPAAAAVEEVRNDGFESGQLTQLQLGFEVSEIAAARLVPTGPCPCQVTGVKFLLGDPSPPTQASMLLWIWEDDLSEVLPFDPGPDLLFAGIMPTSSNEDFQLIDISDEDVFVSGPFRVGLEFLQLPPPSIVRDTDGTITPFRSFIFALPGTWLPAELFGVAGDWVIRAIVETPDPEPVPAAPPWALLPISAVMVGIGRILLRRR